MGIDFRGKGYKRFVRIGKRTVKEGEAVAVWDQYGRHREVRGPALLRLWWSTIRFLEHHIAGAEDYIRIQKRDGTLEHIRGPASLFENPVFHQTVSVERSIAIPDASSHIVVWHKGADVTSRSDSPGSVRTMRTIVAGPTTFFPEPTDNVHTFEWSGEGGGALSAERCVLKLRKQVVRSLKFPAGDSNGHMATVSLTLRAQVVGVEEALALSDPVAAADTLTQAAVLEALASCDFIAQGTSLHLIVQEPLAMTAFTSKLSNVLKMQASLNFISLTVAGATPSADMEKLHRKEDDLNNAKVAEQLAVMSLEAAVARQEREQQLEAAKQMHELKLEEERLHAAHAHAELQDKRRIDNLKELKKLNVDLTKYLVTSVRASPLDENTSETKGGFRWNCWI